MLYHHQTRYDRDRYLMVNLTNTADDTGKVSCDAGAAGPISQTATKNRQDLLSGPFDWKSVMLYSGYMGINSSHSIIKDGSIPSYTNHKTSGPLVKCPNPPTDMVGSGTVSTVCGWEARTDADGVSMLDGSAVLERMFAPYGWKFSTSLGIDGGSTAPLITAVDQANVNPAVPSAPSLYYFRDLQSAKHITAVVRGSDSHLWRRQATGDVWDASWTRFPNGVFTSDAAGVSWGNGRQDIVAVTPSFQVQTLGFHEGLWESIPTPLGAPPLADASSISEPTIASPGLGQLSVYVTGDGVLWRKSLANNNWSAWTEIGRPTAQPFMAGGLFRPGSISISHGTVDVVVRDTAGTLWRFQDPSFTWTSFGTQGASSPAVASMSAGRLDVFVSAAAPGTKGLLLQKTFYPDGTTFGWASVGGVFVSAPGAAGAPDGTGLDVIGLGPDSEADASCANGLWWKRWRPPAKGSPRGYTRADGLDVIVYRAPSSAATEVSGPAPGAFGNMTWNSGSATAGADSDVRGYQRSDHFSAVVFRGVDNLVHELSFALQGSGWVDGTLSGSTLAQGAPFPYVRSDTFNNVKINAVVFRGADDHLHELALTSGWQQADLTAISGLHSLLAGDPMAYVRSDGRNTVVYHAADGHIHEMALVPGNSPPWVDSDLFGASGETVAAAGDPWGYVRADGNNAIVYRGTDSMVHEILFTPSGNPQWTHLTLPGVSAAGNPSGYVRADNLSAVVYRAAADGSIHELVRNPNWADGSLNIASGVPVVSTSGDPVGRKIGTASSVTFLSPGLGQTGIVELRLGQTGWVPSLF
jgi:hypothetical protein